MGHVLRIEKEIKSLIHTLRLRGVCIRERQVDFIVFNEAVGEYNERTMSQEVVIEIRAAEGGDDAKLLVLDQFRVYLNAARRQCL